MYYEKYICIDIHYAFFAFLLFGQKMEVPCGFVMHRGAKAEITSKKQSPTLRIAVSELQNFWQGGIPVTLEVRTIKNFVQLGNEGYTIQTSKGGNQITIASSGEQGVLYGTYHLLRLQATGQLPESALQSLNISERPDYRIRILNHWDNLMVQSNADMPDIHFGNGTNFRLLSLPL